MPLPINPPFGVGVAEIRSCECRRHLRLALLTGTSIKADAVADQDKVVQTLRAGCAHMRRAFDIESINVDDLISTALNDQKAVGTGIKAFHGINFADLNVAYHRFCR